MANPSLAALLSGWMTRESARLRKRANSTFSFSPAVDAPISARRSVTHPLARRSCSARFPGQRVLRQADRLLAGFEKRVKAHWPLGPMRMSSRRREVAGIAGTVVEASYSYPMVRWWHNATRKAISVAWTSLEREVQRGSTWQRFFSFDGRRLFD